MARAVLDSPHPAPHTSVVLNLGVFFLFAPIGFLIALCDPSPWAVSAGIINAIFSGLLSLGWMHTFRERRYWLIIPLIIVPMFAGVLVFAPLSRLGVLGIGSSMSFLSRRITLAVLAVACLAVGFILFIRYIRRAAHTSSRWKTELDLGQKIHERLVRPVSVIVPGAQIAGRSDASAEMGGDLLELVRGADRADLIVGDVSGHGVAAGVVMALIKGGLHVHLMRSENGSPAELLTDLARIMDQADAPSMFVTMACVRLIHGTRRVEIAMAGHNPVLWWRAAERRLDAVDNEGLPLGINPDETYSTRTIETAPGDWLVLYTDGLFEVLDPAGRQLGMDGFRGLVEQLLRSAIDVGAFTDSVLAGVRAHGPIADDQTIAVIRFVG